MVDIFVAVVIGCGAYYFFNTTPVSAVIVGLLGLVVYMLMDIRAQVNH